MTHPHPDFKAEGVKLVTQQGYSGRPAHLRGNHGGKRPLLGRATVQFIEVDGKRKSIRPRLSNQALRTQFRKSCKRAGVALWVKPFHNLRASRETELAASFPLHVVRAWIGNSTAIAQKHDLQVTDADYAGAAGGTATSGAVGRETV